MTDAADDLRRLKAAILALAELCRDSHLTIWECRRMNDVDDSRGFRAGELQRHVCALAFERLPCRYCGPLLALASDEPISPA